MVGWTTTEKWLKNSRGLPARWKYFGSPCLGYCGGRVVPNIQFALETYFIVPIVKDWGCNGALGFCLMTYLVIVGSSNAVNLTDGLDGLAIIPTVMVAGALAVFAYLSGHAQFASYLHIPHLPGAGELVVFAEPWWERASGFLWFNTYPAQVFMGDVGALALGAALGVVAVIVRQGWCCL